MKGSSHTVHVQHRRSSSKNYYFSSWQNFFEKLRRGSNKNCPPLTHYPTSFGLEQSNEDPPWRILSTANPNAGFLSVLHYVGYQCILLWPMFWVCIENMSFKYSKEVMDCWEFSEPLCVRGSSWWVSKEYPRLSGFLALRHNMWKSTPRYYLKFPSTIQELLVFICLVPKDKGSSLRDPRREILVQESS